MILKKKHLTLFIFIVIILSLKNIAAAPLCSEEDINIENNEVENNEVASNEESSEENIEIIENMKKILIMGLPGSGKTTLA